MTDIEKCPKCGGMEGYVWTYSTDSEMTNGYGKCKSCGAKFT